jgi:hypothetical protein
VCEGTVLPHCAHLFSCGACQRLAAFRVRNRILEVLRFGTPMFRERERKQKTAKRQHGFRTDNKASFPKPEL